MEDQKIIGLGLQAFGSQCIEIGKMLENGADPNYVGVLEPALRMMLKKLHEYRDQLALESAALASERSCIEP